MDKKKPQDQISVYLFANSAFEAHSGAIDAQNYDNILKTNLMMIMQLKLALLVEKNG